jgi:hypothetical protein
MAGILDGLGSLLGQGGAGAAGDPNSPAILAATQNMGASIEGLTLSASTIEAQFTQLNQTQQNQYDTLSKIVANLTPIKDFLVGKADKEASEGDDVAKKSTNKQDPLKADVGKLPDAYGMPANLINNSIVKSIEAITETNHTLGEIKALIDKMVSGSDGDKTKQVVPIIGKDDKKNKDAEASKKKGDGIKDVLDSMLKGVSGFLQLAGALILFAGAMAIFAVLPWGGAMVGLAMFGLFIAGMMMMAQKFANKEGFEKTRGFGELASELSLALILFGIAMLVMSAVVLLVGPAILGLMIITLFFVGFMFLSMLVMRMGPITKGFGKEMQQLSIALLVFAVTMIILGFLLPLVIAAIPATILITLIFMGFIALGVLVSKGATDLQNFAKGAILLSVALLVFALSMIILNLLYKGGLFGLPAMNSPEFWEGPALIMGVFLVFILLGTLISMASDKLVKFALGSILLTLGLLIFAFGLIILNFVYKILIDPSNGPMVEFGDFKIPVSVIVMMGLWVAFIALSLLASLAAGPLLMFAIASILLSVGLIVFAIAMKMLLEVGALVVQNPLALVAAFGAMLAVFGFAIGVGALAALALVPIALFTAAAVLLTVGIVLFSESIKKLIEMGTAAGDGTSIDNAIAAINKVMGAIAGLAITAAIAIVGGALFVAAAVLITPGIFMFAQAIKIMQETEVDTEAIDAFIKQVEYTMGKFGLGMAATAAKAIIGAAPTLLSMTMIAGIFYAAGKSFDIAIEVYEKTKKYDGIDLMGPMLDLINKISASAKEMEGVSIESAVAFAIILDATLGGMERIMAMMDALADPGMKAKIPKAQVGFRDILEGFFGITEEGTWNGSAFTLIGLTNVIGTALDGISEAQLRAAQAIVPLTEAIGNIAEMIVMLSGVQGIDTAISALSQMIPLLEEIVRFSDFFRDEKKGFLGIGGKKSSADQFALASQSMIGDGSDGPGGGMVGMIMSLKKVIDAVSDVQAPEISLASFGPFLQDSIITPLLDLNGAEVHMAIDDFGSMIKDGIVSPALKLDRAEERIESFGNSMKKLNKTLKEFVKEGNGALDGTNSLLSRAGAFADKMKDAAISKIKKAVGKGDNSEASGSDPLLSIAGNVAAIAKKVMAPNANEWGGPVS